VVSDQIVSGQTAGWIKKIADRCHKIPGISGLPPSIRRESG